MFGKLIENATGGQTFLNLFGMYTFRGTPENGSSFGELRYHRKLLTSKIYRSNFDHSLHKRHFAKTTFMEKAKVRFAILNLVMSKNTVELQKSKGLLSKYCLLFPNHQALIDDWLQIWNASSLFFNTNVKDVEYRANHVENIINNLNVENVENLDEF